MTRALKLVVRAIQRNELFWLTVALLLMLYLVVMHVWRHREEYAIREGEK